MKLRLKTKDAKKIKWLKLPDVEDTLIKELRDYNIYRTDEQYNYKFRYKNIIYVLDIPKGFLWDGASVPRWAWSIAGIQQRGIQDAGTLGHDAGYRTKGFTQVTRDNRCCFSAYSVDRKYLGKVICDRRTVDVMMYSAWLHLTRFDHRATIAYVAVRIAGKKHFGGPIPNTGA